MTKEIVRYHRVYFMFPKEKSVDGEIPPNLICVPYHLFSRYGKLFDLKMVRKAIDLCRQERIEIIYAHTFWSALQAIAIRGFTDTPYVLDEHNAEYERFRRTGNRLWPVFMAYEEMAVRLSRLVICVSERDKEAIKRLGMSDNRIYVAYNGVDTSVFRPDEKAREMVRQRLGVKNEPLVLFFGTLDYKPSREALDIIQEHILPKVVAAEPRARFIVAGRNLQCSLHHPNLQYVGLVEKIQDYINASDLVICPIISGGGTRIKILESVACGKRVVSTPIGIEGLDVEILGENLVIADNWEKFAQEIIRFIRLPTYNTQVSDRFIQKYSWSRIVYDLANALDELQV